MLLLRNRHGLNGLDIFVTTRFLHELQFELPQQLGPGGPVHSACIRDGIGRAGKQIGQPHLFGYAPR